MLKVGLDIDEVLADWWHPYIERFGLPKTDWEITKNCQQVLRKDRKFWLNLPVIRRPENFEPTLYCTKRSCLKVYSKTWLDDNDFPHKPVYQQIYQYGSKAPLIKGRVDVFVDDSVSNWIDLNRSGIPCLLMDAPHNRNSGPILRIHSLDYDEIREVYELAKEFNIFKNFVQYI